MSRIRLHRENGYVISPIDVAERRVDATHLAHGPGVFVLVSAHDGKSYTSVKIDEVEARILIAELRAIAHAHRVQAKPRRAKKKRSGQSAARPHRRSRIVDRKGSRDRTQQRDFGGARLPARWALQRSERSNPHRVILRPQ